MIWWLTLAVALLGPAVLLYTGLSMVRRLERLDLAARRVRTSQGEVQAVQLELTRLQQRLEEARGRLPVRRRPAVEPPAGGSAQATAETDGRIRGDRHGSFGRMER
ncbi:MAG: hypothetical protein J2P15_02910 [Micromonosporaceae bacterium]|nr:hypothetical protein [Micromonosporaceae bacterium]